MQSEVNQEENLNTTDFDEHFAKISSYIVDTLHGVPLEMMLIQYPSGAGYPPLSGRSAAVFAPPPGTAILRPQLLRIQNLLIGLLRQDPHVPLDLRPGGQI